LDDNPTTDDVTTSLPSAPVEPERIGSVMLPQKVSELRRKLGQKAKQDQDGHNQVCVSDEIGDVFVLEK